MFEIKSIIIDGIILSYLEKNTKASNTIFFFHGNSNSTRIWKNQYLDNYLSQFRLIIFDLPAHGNSSSSATPLETYNVITMGEIMAKAVEQLSGDAPYLLAGFSLGTNIIAEMLFFGSHPKGLIMAGSTLVGGLITPVDVVMPGVAGGVLFADNVEEQLIFEYVHACCMSANTINKAELIEDYYCVKSPFRSAFKESILKGKYSDEIFLVSTSDLPVLIIYGEEEKITPPHLLDNLSINFWGNEAFRLSGASHTVMLDQPSAFNELLESFIKEIF